jgi:hypothetical protein
VVLTGMAANICVLFTANDAYMRDLHLAVPSDYMASNTEEENRYASTRCGSHGRKWSRMLPLYEDPCFTLRFAEARIIARFHLESVQAGGCRSSRLNQEPASGWACWQLPGWAKAARWT